MIGLALATVRNNLCAKRDYFETGKDCLRNQAMKQLMNKINSVMRDTYETEKWLRKFFVVSKTFKVQTFRA